MSTKLQKKIEQEANRIVSVAEHGAVGDGIADDTAAIQTAVDAAPPVEAAMEPVAAAVPDSLHALDAAPVNSKLVKTDEGAFLATPDSVTRLPDGDPAHKLPEGAKILKRAADAYWSIQLSPAEDRPVLVTTTAMDAIAQFIPHFHEG